MRMSDGLRQSSLHNLAHIANMSHELQVLNQQLQDESSNNNSHAQAAGTGITSPSSQSKNGKPKRMACVECRQQKSRCDAHEKHPAPCTRCAKKGLQCDLKSDYKRTYKRARIAQIEKEFSELKKKLTTAQAAELLERIPSLAGDQTPTLSSVSPQLQSSDNLHQQNVSQLQQQYQMDHSNMPGAHSGPDSWPTSVSPYNQNDTRYSHNSSETNNSIPNTPSIVRPAEQVNVNDSKVNSEYKEVIPEHILECEEKNLDKVSLSSNTIKALYKEYVHYYHPILPVVNISMGPETIYKLCPALFWVIMFVSLRRFHDASQKTLLLQLSPIVKDILAEITISPITRHNPTTEDEPILNACSVYSVQAFLLYTFWPPITSSLSADSSWNTIGVALFQAIRIGLHTPGQLIPDNSNQEKLSMAQEQAKTWIACNVVSQTIATVFGFPAFVQFNTSVANSRIPGRSIQVPKAIKFMKDVADFEDQVAKTLNANPVDPCGLVDPTERLPLLKILSRQLDELELRMNNDLPADDGFRKFQLLAARVHLLTYYFMDSSRIAHFELQKGLVGLYNAAIALINHAQIYQAKNQTFVKYLPGVYILNIWQASCIIGKLSHSPLKKVLDLGSGKQSYQAAISLAAKASILKHDIAHRSSGIMRNMWQLFATLDEKKLTSMSISIRSRMAASVFFDCLYLLRGQVGMIKLSNRNNDDEENEGGSYDEDEEYGYQDMDESAVSDEEDKSKDGSQRGSNKSTPGSNTSNKSKRPRSLSETINAESKARKIIQTIPLDPQPIPVDKKRNSIFKVASHANGPGRGTSNKEATFKSPNSGHTRLHAQQAQRPQHQYSDHDAGQATTSGRNDSPQSRNTPAKSNNQTHNHITGNRAYDVPFTDMVLNESPIQGGLENLEMDNFDINSDLLWKDVDSVMNDFGFHTQ